jgi:hypothetical protein
MVIERFQVFLVRLDPATGAETAKTRPCVVVSPDELNSHGGQIPARQTVGKLDAETANTVLDTLGELFAP